MSTLFDDHPRIYDKLYREMKDYAWEVDKLEEHFPERAKTVLDVGCGTGLHDQYLVDEYDVLGVDQAESMLSVAKDKNPTARYRTGSLRDIPFEEDVDVILCLFGVLSYLDDEDAFQDAITTMGSRLSDGGVLLIDFVDRRRRKGYEEGPMRIETYREDGLRVTRTGRARIPRVDTLILEYHITVATEDSVEGFDDTHELRHFSEDQYREAFRKAGLEAGLVGDDWPVWVAEKQA